MESHAATVLTPDAFCKLQEKPLHPNIAAPRAIPLLPSTMVLAVTITCFTPQQPSSSAPRHLLRRCHASSSSSATRQNHDTAPTPGCFALSPPSSSPSLHRLLYL
eukprot:TRINITY_DN8057_c0_g2_i1.p2 TRINITY_DN8057_c0_g2~~TRINITY_DN8057_c0_g2_i1.p2  ORF type:complete len:112 (+),score=15.43 TRINITY_DN8057_c0_g2_i1:24-338(+)